MPERSVVTMVMELAGETNRCDINADGVVDIDDVNLVINAVLGKLDNADMLARADVTGSGAVDVDDLNIIINTLLGKS